MHTSGPPVQRKSSSTLTTHQLGSTLDLEDTEDPITKRKQGTDGVRPLVTRTMNPRLFL